MALIRHLCGAGEFPRHHLWGADYLERAGYGVEYGFFGGYRRSLTRLSWALGGRLGDVEQQAAMLRRTDANTVIYGGEASLLRGLSTLRRAGLKLPLVAVAHGGGGGWIRGLDVAICLTTKARGHLTSRYGRDPALTPLATWGPDLGFAHYSSTGEEIVVSAGKTDRDVDTLLRALEGIDVPARIYADRPAGGRGVVEIVQAAAGPPLPYADVLNDLRRASIVAIPLEPGHRAVGLTEINDALALGKPIVMTRTDAIDFDPEQVGCGLSVDPHDVSGWREALRRLAGDAGLRAEMGRRGRAFAEDGYNLDAFGAAVVDAVRTAADRRRARRR
jgi:glycosyltransferase involved in cell wall biosynthesis